MSLVTQNAGGYSEEKGEGGMDLPDVRSQEDPSASLRNHVA